MARIKAFKPKGEGYVPVPVSKLTPLETQLLEALRAASEHLDYCGYGDKWERECAKAAGLEKQINAAIEAAEKEEA